MRKKRERREGDEKNQLTLNCAIKMSIMENATLHTTYLCC